MIWTTMENDLTSALRDMRIEREAHARAMVADRSATAKLLADNRAVLERGHELIAWFPWTAR
jgi:hypothetical protein